MAKDFGYKSVPTLFGMAQVAHPHNQDFPGDWRVVERGKFLDRPLDKFTYNGVEVWRSLYAQFPTERDAKRVLAGQWADINKVKKTPVSMCYRLANLCEWKAIAALFSRPTIEQALRLFKIHQKRNDSGWYDEPVSGLEAVIADLKGAN